MMNRPNYSRCLWIGSSLIPSVTLMLGISWMACLPGSCQAAEIFVLKTGGRVQGLLLNQKEIPREKFIVRTAAGGEITFLPNQVEQIIQLSEEELLYEKLQPTTPDTVEGHKKMADWCQDKGLISERKTHLERILQLDPDHAVARSALGYLKSQGEWVTREEMMGDRGYMKYRGRWITPQEIQLQEEERRAELAKLNWVKRMKRLRDMLNSKNMAEAIAEIKEIRDPLAVPALANYLEINEPRALKLLLIETLEKIPTTQSLKALVQVSLQDPDQEVRLSSLDSIVRMENGSDAVNLYIIALQSKDNQEINRAAQGLQALGDPLAIEPLFDALISEHKFKVVTQPAGSTSATFPSGGGGGGGMTFGNNGPKTFRKYFKNPAVLMALVKLTNQNYSYEVNDWKRWYAARQRAAGFSARRD